jgi:hypothetical protein
MVPWGNYAGFEHFIAYCDPWVGAVWIPQKRPSRITGTPDKHRLKHPRDLSQAAELVETEERPRYGGLSKFKSYSQLTREPTHCPFLRRVWKPTKPKPPAKSGSVAGSGVAVNAKIPTPKPSGLLSP